MPNPEISYPLGTHPSNPIVIRELNHSATPFDVDATVPFSGGARWYQILKFGDDVVGIDVVATNGDLILNHHTGVWPSMVPLGGRGGINRAIISPATTHVSVQAGPSAIAPIDRVFTLATLTADRDEE
jgi:hypothetical protein